jgi:hypothetical protein
MSFLDHFRRKKGGDDEVMRRARLLLTGRIADGMIFDTQTDESGAVFIFYSYNIGGVDYESSQTLNYDQRRRQDEYKPGAGITVRYDPRHPTNSVVV